MQLNTHWSGIWNYRGNCVMYFSFLHSTNLLLWLCLWTIWLRVLLFYFYTLLLLRLVAIAVVWVHLACCASEVRSQCSIIKWLVFPFEISPKVENTHKHRKWIVSHTLICQRLNKKTNSFKPITYGAILGSQYNNGVSGFLLFLVYSVKRCSVESRYRLHFRFSLFA